MLNTLNSRNIEGHWLDGDAILISQRMYYGWQTVWHELMLHNPTTGESEFVDKVAISGLDWHPNGERLAYTVTRIANEHLPIGVLDDNFTQVEIADYRDGQHHVVATLPVFTAAPDWSPDGELLAYYIYFSEDHGGYVDNYNIYDTRTGKSYDLSSGFGDRRQGLGWVLLPD